ncbi:HD-GYP domain-containing protein [Pseudomonas sp. SLFW]|uniref:HD-GYP domain-containing protein n=1 Tax=Pseudomonas sp. SLFW TaxID=2683259 RepID=UPI001C49AE47|nr:HD-GYP domain-containing protein [Pseudomonas sp. SLFW]
MKLMQRLNDWLGTPVPPSPSADTPLLASLLSMAWLVEARDPYTGGHLWRVSQYCALLADKAGLPATEVQLIALGGFVHDLGKIGIPDAVLRKAGRLEENEYDVIKTHPEIGKRLLDTHPLAGLVMDAVWSHHEMPNGRGYPRGLSGDQIPRMAAITGICDAFDAMTSDRPYRKGMPLDDALKIVEDSAGSQFHEAYAHLFVSLGREGGLQHILGHTDAGIPLRRCENCGPTVVVSRTHGAGDLVFCPACEMGYELYRPDQGNLLRVRGTGKKGTADQLKPVPDQALIQHLAQRLTPSVAA